MATIALIAHDNCKAKLLEWAKQNKDVLKEHSLVATGTTGSLLAEKLELDVKLYKSGPLGGDLQIGAAIVDGDINCVVFLWDPMEPHPHDVDVKALLRIAVVKDIPIACNKSSANCIVKQLSNLPEKAEDTEEREDEGLQLTDEAVELGIDKVLEEFIAENEAVIERFQAGFKTLLNTLSSRMVKKLGLGTDSLDRVANTLEELFSSDTSKELTEAQKVLVTKMLRQLYTQNEIEDIFVEYMANKDTTPIDEIAEKIHKLDWRCDAELTSKFVQEYFESQEEHLSDILARREAEKQEAEEETLTEEEA